GDIEKVSIAALLHDIAKEQSDAEMRDLIISENLNLNLLKYGNEIWHGPVGAILAEREFLIENETILDSIRQHTVGGRNMTLTAQIVFVADYIEEGRTFSKVDKARELAKHSLKEAIKYKLKETMKHLISIEEKIFPATIESYNSWISK
ncbi:MAG: bis(5'-nucleosyl)-tetraphosphatase (symmetrical) YqeK, partial [Atopostipes suicloacalis]|nr:bis(5'-nucleosyl)-tetraphosphatase (symmetrical) YqeK [Atopostipes suicloacalis]